MKATRSMLVAGAMSVLLGANGYAQDPIEQLHSSETSNREIASNSSQMDQSQNEQTIEGEIIGFRHARRFSENAPTQTRSYIRLRQEDGRTTVVDAGPKSNLDRLHLRAGEQLQAHGVFREMGGKRVLAADEITVNGQTVTVEEPRSQQRNLAGRIDGFQSLQVQSSQGEEQTHALIKLQLRNGQTRIVDLGPRERLNAANLELGDRVRLRVEQGTLDGEPILLADRMRNVSRSGPEAEGGTGKEISIHGHVQGYQVWTIEENGQPMALLELQLRNGKSVFVGTDQYHAGEFDLRDLALGDEVQIKAHEIGSQNGQELIADSIKFAEPRSLQSERRLEKNRSEENPGS